MDDAYLKTASALLDLPIRPEHLDEVMAAFAVITSQARLITEFPLPETTEAAQRFIP